MEIYIDFRGAKDKVELAQAIRVLAITYKEDNFNIIVNEDKATLIETDNIKFIDSVEIDEIDNLYQTNYDHIDDSYMKINFLKAPKKKSYTKILLTDLAKNTLTLEEKYELLNKYKFIDKNHNFAVLSSSLGLDEEFDKFVDDHNKEQYFIGKVLPKEIILKDAAVLLTNSIAANLFIDSLYYTVNYFQFLYQDDSAKPGFFQNLFSFNKPAPYKAVVINALIDEVDFYLNKDRCIAVCKDDMNYNYYYQTLAFYVETIKKNSK